MTPEEIDGKQVEIVFGKDFRDSYLRVEGQDVACYSAEVAVETHGRTTVRIELEGRDAIEPLSLERLVVSGTLKVDPIVEVQ